MSAQLPEVEVGALWEALERAADLAGLAVFVARLTPGPPAVVYASALAAELIGRGEPAQLVGLEPWVILRPEDQKAIIEMVGRPAGAPPVAVEVQILRPDGQLVPILLTTTRIVTSSTTLSFGYMRDLTKERQTRAALAKSEARFRFLLDQAPDGVGVVQDGKIVYLNPAARDIIGGGAGVDLVGHPIQDFVVPEELPRSQQRLRELEEHRAGLPPAEYRLKHAPDRHVEIKSVPIEWEGAPAILSFSRDVTERKAIEARLVEADRLAALGTLAAAVAHEINNPLTYVQLTAQRIARALADRPDVREALQDIQHGIARIASISAGLRSFARADDAVPGPVDLVRVVERALQMVNNDLRHRAKLVKHLPAMPDVLGTAGKLEQVIVNLLLNAIQALPATPTTPGTIGVTLSRRDRGLVALAISDNGRGMPAEVRKRIFEPFFTTRPAGESMGLGLAVSKTIIDSLGGTIEVASTEGAGTTVTLVLPLHAASAPAAPEPPVDVTAETRRRVLVIDDEPLVRNVLAKLLAESHTVTAVASGAEGLYLLATTTFDVIICDVMMPGMNGREVYRRIAQAHPGLERRLVFISGGTFAPELEAFLETIPNPKLAKPFRLDEVLAVVDQIAKST